MAKISIKSEKKPRFGEKYHVRELFVPFYGSVPGLRCTSAISTARLFSNVIRKLAQFQDNLG